MVGSEHMVILYGPQRKNNAMKIKDFVFFLEKGEKDMRQSHLHI